MYIFTGSNQYLDEDTLFDTKCEVLVLRRIELS